MNRRLAIASVVLGLACTALAAKPEKPTAPPTKPLADEMQNHWIIATDIRDRVIVGDLAGARLVAKALSERQVPEALPTRWRPLYAEMQVAADKVATASSIEAAAAATGRLALTCSECHDFTSAGPKKLILPMPPPALGAGDSDMPVHKWGIDWLWIGLIASDPASWDRGAKGLEQAPFHKHPHFPESGRGLEAMEHLAHLLPGLAEKEDRVAQAQRFGETLTACALCHTAPEEEPEPATEEPKEAP